MASLLPCLSHFMQAVFLSLTNRGSRSFSGALLRNLSPYGNPLPRPLHVTLNEDDLNGKRVFVVGDVHGCYDELRELLANAKAMAPDVQVVFVGDLINKGPKNLECVQFAQRIGALCVRGNHDEFLINDYLLCRRRPKTLPDGAGWMEDMSADSFRWLLNLPYTIRLPWCSAVIVHAGFLPGVPIEEQRLLDMTEIRNVVVVDDGADAEGAMGRRYEGIKNIDRGVPWASLWQGPEHVYFGHNACRGLQQEEHATGLDTGCVYGGALSGLYLDDPGRIYQVKAKVVHSPPKVKIK